LLGHFSDSLTPPPNSFPNAHPKQHTACRFVPFMPLLFASFFPQCPVFCVYFGFFSSSPQPLRSQNRLPFFPDSHCFCVRVPFSPFFFCRASPTAFVPSLLRSCSRACKTCTFLPATLCYFHEYVLAPMSSPFFSRHCPPVCLFFLFAFLSLKLRFFSCRLRYTTPDLVFFYLFLGSTLLTLKRLPPPEMTPLD